MELRWALSSAQLSHFQKTAWLFLPEVLDSPKTEELANLSQRLPSRRVHTDAIVAEWSERQIFEGSPLWEVFTAQSTLERIAQCLEVTPRVLECGVAWVSEYSRGEFIDPHKDNDGAVQLLICLAMKADIGGELMMRDKVDVEHSFRLRPGDAVLFKASELEHWTSPLDCNDPHVEPRRAVVVGRYYSRPIA